MAAPMDITALTPAELATLLQKAGGKKITRELIDQHIADGAPVNGDGRLHFVHYVAWLATQVK